MSGAGAVYGGGFRGPEPGCPRGPEPGSFLQRLFRSEAERMELQRNLIEYRRSDTCLMKLKYMKLKNYLKEVHERQERARLRNQTLLEEFDQFEARMKASSLEMTQKMEASCRREMKRVLLLGGADLAAEGDEEWDCMEQTPWAGTGTRTTVLRQLYDPVTGFTSHHTSAVSADGGLGTQQNRPQPTESCSAPDPSLCLPSLEGLGLESPGTDLERDASVEGAARPGDVAANEEDSEELISSASDSKPGPKPGLGNWCTPKELSWDISTVLPGPASTKEMMPSVLQGLASPVADWEQDRDAHTAEDSPLHAPNPHVEQEELPLVSSAPGSSRGMLAALSQALEQIEDVVRRSPRRQALYQGEHMVTLELLSGATRLEDGDLEACEAVVLHHLRASLQSTLDGCLLPENTLQARGRAEDEEQSRPEQWWDMDVLRPCLSKHALFLRKHQVQLPEEVSEMFKRLLAQDGQALPGWGEALPGESGDRSSPHSHEPSCSTLSSTPNGARETEEAEHAPGLTGIGGQEVPSWCEDESKEESAVEKIPITGWDGGGNGSKARESHETQSETSPSSSPSPPLSRAETRKGMVAAIKSKAFWGESDESSSELEAALRPQAHSTEADEFDDFYD